MQQAFAAQLSPTNSHSAMIATRPPRGQHPFHACAPFGPRPLNRPFIGPPPNFCCQHRPAFNAPGILGPPPPHHPVQCWHCHQFGHVQAKCPQSRPFVSMHVASSSDPN